MIARTNYFIPKTRGALCAKLRKYRLIVVERLETRKYAVVVFCVSIRIITRERDVNTSITSVSTEEPTATGHKSNPAGELAPLRGISSNARNEYARSFKEFSRTDVVCRLPGNRVLVVGFVFRFVFSHLSSLIVRVFGGSQGRRRPNDSFSDSRETRTYTNHNIVRAARSVG